MCGHRCFGAPDRVWRPCFAESFTDPSTAAVTDPTNTEDVKAGNLGMPFTETEDEEEWIGWVNWAEVEAETGGSSTGAA